MSHDDDRRQPEDQPTEAAGRADGEPGDRDLELASAYLDGELSADEAERVESDMVLLDLVEQLRPARLTTLDLPPVDPGRRSAHVGAAMDLFDQLHGGSTAGATPERTERAEPAVAAGATIDLTEERARRQVRGPGETPTTGRSATDRRPMMLRLSQMAAAIVLIAGVGLGLRAFGDAGTNDSADDATAETAADAADRAADDAFASELATATAEAEESGAADDGEMGDAGGVDEDAADEAMSGAADEDMAAGPVGVVELEGPIPAGETAIELAARVLGELEAQATALGLTEGDLLVDDGARCEALPAGVEYVGHGFVVGAVSATDDVGELHVWRTDDGELAAVVFDSDCVEVGRSET